MAGTPDVGRLSATGPPTGRLRAHLIDVAVIAIAIAGIWLFWSHVSYLSGLSWWYDSTQRLRATTIQGQPDYDLRTLPWQVAHSRVFQFNEGRLTVVTGVEPFAYQAYATVRTGRAASADLHFDADVESGEVTIGLLQAGKWIATSTSQRPGAFSDSNAARLGYNSTVTVVIANNNAAGESRVTLKSLRLFFRK